MRSFFVFCANSEASVKKSWMLRYFNHHEFPNLEAFLKLGLPLRQIIKVKPNGSPGDEGPIANEGSPSPEWDSLEHISRSDVISAEDADLTQVLKEIVQGK